MGFDNGKKGRKVHLKYSSSECHLSDGNDHRNKKCASKESLDNNSGVVWKWKNCYSTEISLLLKFWSSLQQIGY